jgi:ATP-dependent RNA helicase DDX3X
MFLRTTNWAILGRTGRIGNMGLASSFYNDRDSDLAETLVKVLLENGQQIPDFLQEHIPEGFSIDDQTGNVNGDVQALTFDDESDDEEADGEEDGEKADGDATAAAGAGGWGATETAEAAPAAGGGWGAATESVKAATAAEGGWSTGGGGGW